MCATFKKLDILKSYLLSKQVLYNTLLKNNNAKCFFEPKLHTCIEIFHLISFCRLFSLKCYGCVLVEDNEETSVIFAFF